MVAVPALIAVTTPVDGDMVPTTELLLVQVPPVVASDNVVDDVPAHIEVEPAERTTAGVLHCMVTE